jgi:hypothetical protein
MSHPIQYESSHLKPTARLLLLLYLPLSLLAEHPRILLRSLLLSSTISTDWFRFPLSRSKTCTPPGVSDLVQVVEELEREQKPKWREEILADHGVEDYSWNQSHPPALNVQVPTSRVRQSPSASSATSMRRAVLAASRPGWI